MTDFMRHRHMFCLSQLSRVPGFNPCLCRYDRWLPVAHPPSQRQLPPARCTLGGSSRPAETTRCVAGATSSNFVLPTGGAINPTKFLLRVNLVSPCLPPCFLPDVPSAPHGPLRMERPLHGLRPRSLCGGGGLERHHMGCGDQRGAGVWSNGKKELRQRSQGEPPDWKVADISLDLDPR